MSRRRGLPPRRSVKQFDPALLERELRGQQETTTPQAIVARYARLQSNGKPARCTPSRSTIERDDPKGLHSFKKVIFDNEDRAEACATELATVLDPRDVARYVYPCPRSRSGHVHLTSKRPVDANKDEEKT